MDKQIKQMLQKALNYIEKGGSLVADEIPGFLKELVRWQSIHHGWNVFVCLLGLTTPILCFASIVGSTAFFSQFTWVDNLHIFANIVVGAGLSFLTIMCLCNLPYQSFQLFIRSIFAPRLTLIMSLKELVNE